MNGMPSSSSMVDDVVRTKILLLGQRRSGKTSIQQVLFSEADPKQTFYLEPTIRIMKHKHDTIIPLEIWDCPGNITVETLGVPLSTFSMIIFVIDIQDSFTQPIARLLPFFTAAWQESPSILLEVFVHKAEAIQQEYKNDNFRNLQDRLLGELDDMAGFEDMQVDFHLTSIYDYSVYEAFSELITRLVSSISNLEELLNAFCANSQASKAYLFDNKSRLYVATDTSPPDVTHHLCCDYLKTVNAFGSLYRSVSDSPLRIRTVPSGTSSSPKPSFYPSASMKLGDPLQGISLTYHVVTPQLALIALLPTSVWESKRGLVEYNVVFFREGVQEIWEVEMEARREAAAENV